MDRDHAESGGLPDLTKGGILRLIESEGHFTFGRGHDEKQPTLQIINIRRVPANALTDVYWVSLQIMCPSFYFVGDVCGFIIDDSIRAHHFVFVVPIIRRRSCPTAKIALRLSSLLT